MKAVEMNCEVLCCVAELWVNVFDFEAAGSVPRTPPLNMITPEVNKFWEIMKEEGQELPSKTQRYVDSWGIRKLTSHALRNLRQDRLPRSRDLQHLFMIYIRAWYVQTDPLPPPAGVLPDLVPDDGETYDDSEDPVPALEDGEYEEVKSVHYDVDSLPLDNNLFGDSMGDSAMPAPSVVPRCDPSAVDTLPCDLPGDFSLAMPSPPPAESSSAASSSLSELDRRILELQRKLELNPPRDPRESELLQCEVWIEDTQDVEDHGDATSPPPSKAMTDPDAPEKVPPTVLDTPTPAKDFSHLQVNPKSPEQLGVEPLASDTSKADKDDGSKSAELEFSSVCPSPSPANEEPLNPEDLNEDSIPPTQPEPKEMEEEAGEEHQHHILDELLTRHKQDIALGKNPGKGRKKKGTTEVKATQAKTKSSKGRGRGRGKGRGRGSKKAAEEEAAADMNPDEENFSLLKAEPELWIDSDAEAEPASKTDKQQQQAAESPAVKPKARKGKKAVKAESGASASSPAPRAKAKANAKGKAKTSSKGDKAKEGATPKEGLTTRKRKAPEAGTDTPKTPKAKAKAKAKAGKSPKAKAAAKALAKKSKAGPKADPEAPSSPSAAAPKPPARKPKVKMNQPFKHSTIVPYWSRQAIALKVQTGLGVSGLTQVYYLAVRGMETQDLVAPISKIATMIDEHKGCYDHVDVVRAFDSMRNELQGVVPRNRG